ncbi:Leucine rich repeat family protein [Acanthocheilonema viteae]
MYSEIRDITCPQNCSCIGWTSTICSSVTEPDALFVQLKEQQLTLLNLSLTESGLSDLTHFPTMKRLTFLDLSNNCISIFNTSRGNRFPNLRQLIIRHNHFLVLERDAFIMFPAMELLDLSYNFISKVDWEAFRLYRLKQLIIANNNLTNINEHMLRFMTSLHYLDLSYNNLQVIKSSHFFSAQKLKEMNLSHNKIKTFIYDSFSSLYQLEVLDLSYNDIKIIPSADLRQLVGLRVLRIGANHFKRIANSELKHPMLHEIDLSYSSKLRVLEQFAFSQIPNLHTVNLSYSKSLTYLSPRAFIKNTMLYSVDFSHCALEVLPDELLSTVSQGFFDHNPLRCGCIIKSITKDISHLRNLKQTTCLSARGILRSITAHATWTLEECRPEPILPFGELMEATIGEQCSIYCASRQPSDSLLWRLPNRTDIPTRNYFTNPTEEINSNDIMYSHHLSTYRQFNFNQKATNVVQPRVWATNEQIWLDVVLAEDEGEYRCTVKREQHFVHQTIHLKVKEPAIAFYVIEVGSHYVTLAWNASLPVHAKDRVHFFIAVRDEYGMNSRTVQLSLYNPWHNYKIMRLKNYTFCLCYALVSGMQESIVDKVIYETCLQQRTASNLSFIESINLSTLLITIVIMLLFLSLVFFRVLHTRFHVWQLQRHKSRINQSISGRIFMLSTSNSIDPIVTTYENQLELNSSQCTSLNQCLVANVI